MKRVLVTGASGLVGRHVLAPLVERGFDVHAVARRLPERTTAGVVWHQVDILDRAATAAVLEEVGATHLLHLAWYTEHGRFWNAHENLDWVAASLLLVRGFRAAGGQRAVLAGTCAEYDWSGDCCGESTPLEPATLYGLSKKALWQLVEAYALASGLSAAWGRIFFLFGPGEQRTRVVAAAAAALAAGHPFACSEGSQVRDFLYAADVAAAFMALVDAEATGAFDIGSGQPLTLRDLLLRLGRLADGSALLRFGEASARDEPARIVADPRRLREEVGWHPATPLDQALEETLAWWRESSSRERRGLPHGAIGESP